LAQVGCQRRSYLRHCNTGRAGDLRKRFTVVAGLRKSRDPWPACASSRHRQPICKCTLGLMAWAWAESASAPTSQRQRNATVENLRARPQRRLGDARLKDTSLCTTRFILAVAKLVRTYRPGDPTWRPFGIGASKPYEMNLYFGSPASYQEVKLVKPDGGTVHFARVSPGTGYADAVFEHTGSQSMYYKAQIRFLGNPSGWELKLRDGTWFQFGFENPVLISFRDRFGNAVTVTRSGGHIVRLTTPSGRYIDFTYGAPNYRIRRWRTLPGGW
jgi:hypothetical protein